MKVFFASLLQYAVKFVLFAAVAVGGIFLGKALRDRKNAKETGQIQEEK